MARSVEAKPAIDPVVRELDAMARHHFTWITESFVHVLILHEWNERVISKRIDDEYMREISRCFRIVERILELDGCPSLEAGREPYSRHLTHAGRTVAEMIEREHARMAEFSDQLERAAQVLASAGEAVGSAIAREAISSRAIYLDWISGARRSIGEELRDRTMSPVTGTSRPYWIALNRLYAQLQPAIEETCVHMLILRAEQRSELADQTWRDSFAFMFHATAIVQQFGRRDWAFELADSEVSGDVLEPAIARSVAGALDSERNRLEMLIEAASEANETLAASGDPDLEAIPREVLEYARARSEGETGKAPRRARSIETMLDDYSYPISQNA